MSWQDRELKPNVKISYWWFVEFIATSETPPEVVHFVRCRNCGERLKVADICSLPGSCPWCHVAKVAERAEAE